MSAYIQPEKGGSFEYIRDGAIIVCNKGSLPCPLRASIKKTYFAGDTACTEIDNGPVNMIDFGVCAVTKKPCRSCISLLNWQDVKMDMLVEGARPLLERSSLPCAIGGKITFMTSGQL